MSSHPGPEFEGPAGQPGGPDRPSGDQGRMPDGVPDFTGPAAQEPEFRPCYRHPDRATGISCQRCSRPICLQCMTEASVGFQCPECVGEARHEVRRPVTVVGAEAPSRPAAGSGPSFLSRLQVRDHPVTWALVALGVLVGLVDAVSGGLAGDVLGLHSGSVFAGEWWRLLTAVLVPGSLLNAVFSGLFLVLIGRSLEPVLGSWRYAAVFVTAGLVGSALYLVAASQSPYLVPGMHAGIMGLIAASATVKLRLRMDIRFDLVLLGLLVVLSLVVGPAAMLWVNDIGGILGGGGAALVMLFAPRQRRTTIQVAGLAVIWVVALVAAVAAATLA